MKWFKGINSLKDLHKAFIKLAKEHHGSEEIMKEINNEYDLMVERLKRGYSFQSENFENPPDITDTEEFKKVIDKIIHLDGIEIELCGRWLWISGNTYKHKESLKSAGCKWSNNKKMWYWHEKTEKKDCRRKGISTIEEIRKWHGSEVIASNFEGKKIKRLTA